MENKRRQEYSCLVQNISEKEEFALRKIFYPKSISANNELQRYLACAKITTTKVIRILNWNIFRTVHALNTEEYKNNSDKNNYEQTVELKDTSGNGLDDIVINHEDIPSSPLILRNLGHKRYIIYNPLNLKTGNYTNY